MFTWTRKLIIGSHCVSDTHENPLLFGLTLKSGGCPVPTYNIVSYRADSDSGLYILMCVTNDQASMLALI